MPLSSREQEILAAIENELSEKDPTLVATFTETRSPSPVLQRVPLSARHTYLLILALLALVILHTFVPQLTLAGSAILTGMLIVPWIVSASRAAERRFGNVPGTPQTGPADQDVLT
jgi:Flp pilus assembly protein TadB